jgi:hypothetical protein
MEQHCRWIQRLTAGAHGWDLRPVLWSHPSGLGKEEGAEQCLRTRQGVCELLAEGWETSSGGTRT